MSTPPEENTYLQQVLEEQAAVDQRLKRSKAPMAPLMAAAPAPSISGLFGSSPLPSGGKAVDYRITGFGIWKSVIVPPNVYTIHTRRGHTQPIQMGKGISFRFNPLTDAFLIIPASVQTILINAKCICIERQGVMVQAYVQWIIEDIQTAYWKLDFSDAEDPMGIVNLQLREQAEAAIKDKVATLSIDEVLSDKQPIIEELTHRLQTVAEGSSEVSPTERSEGLGLKIVTVQIKEAVVSSTQLWQNLQAPFRAEREKVARLAQLESEREIKAQELENQLESDRNELNATNEIDELRAQQARLKYDREQAEALRRSQLEQEAERRVLAEQNRTALARNQAQLDLALQELELDRQRIAAEIEQVQMQIQLNTVSARRALEKMSARLEREELEHQATARQRDRLLDLDQKQREIENNISAVHLQSQLIEKLPDIAEHLGSPNEQRTVIITSEGQGDALNPLLGFFTSIATLTQEFFQRRSA
jgi:flotillin